MNDIAIENSSAIHYYYSQEIIDLSQLVPRQILVPPTSTQPTPVLEIICES
jgi:hypothetical protein